MTFGSGCERCFCISRSCAWLVSVIESVCWHSASLDLAQMHNLDPHIDPQSILVFFDPACLESLAPPNLCAFFSNDFLE